VKNKKNILITGGAGFIGSNLALRLVEKGHKVTVMDNLSPQIHGADPETQSPLYQSIRNQVYFVRGDVTSVTDWQSVLPGQDVIVHLAAETGTGQSMYQIKHYTDVNIGGTALMLDLLAAGNGYAVRKVVVASSRAIYGEGKYIHSSGSVVYPSMRSTDNMRAGDFHVYTEDSREPLQSVPTDESSRLHPSSVYGITKLNQEQMVMTVCPALGIAPVAFRYQNVYGPGQSLRNPYTGILSIFSTQILNGLPISIFEDGEESRDFVFINDVVETTIAGIEMPEADGYAFNVGMGTSVTVMEVANQLINAFGLSVPCHITGDFRVGDIRHNRADITLLQQRLGITPQVSFRDGIIQFVEWVKTQEKPESRYDASIQEMKQKGLMK